jgi:hypothetical protein
MGLALVALKQQSSEENSQVVPDKLTSVGGTGFGSVGGGSVGLGFNVGVATTRAVAVDRTNLCGVASGRRNLCSVASGRRNLPAEDVAGGDTDLMLMLPLPLSSSEPPLETATMITTTNTATAPIPPYTNRLGNPAI